MLRTGFSRNFATSSRVLANYGFIGLGQMGQHMARHIYDKLGSNDTLYVNDTSEKAVDTFIKENTSANPGNAAQLFKVKELEGFVTQPSAPLDYIITMVPEGHHVKCVISTILDKYKEQGIEGIHPTVFLDSSTIDIQTSQEIQEYVKKEVPAFDFIDAPVSGGVAGARNGTLSFMLSRNSTEDIDLPLLTLLQKMGINIFPCGSNHGAGLAAKLSNNYLLAITNLAVADSFQLAKSFGLNLKEYAKLVSVSTGKSWASVDNCPIPGAYPPEKKLPADVQYQGGFITKLTRKDLVLATASAAKNNRSLYMGDIGKFWYDKACEDESLASRDLGVLYEWLGEIDTAEVLKSKK